MTSLRHHRKKQLFCPQDPGNLEGDLQAGANTGYILLWVLVWSTVMVRTDKHSQALTISFSKSSACALCLAKHAAPSCSQPIPDCCCQVSNHVLNKSHI